MVLLDPLGLIFTDCDVLPFHSVYYMLYVYEYIGSWACGPATSRGMREDDGAVSPPYCASCPLARTAVLLEEGGLAPAIS